MESDAFVTALLALALASCVAWAVKLVSFDTRISLAAVAVAVEEEDSDSDDFVLFAASAGSISDDCDDDFLLDHCRRCGGWQARRTIIVETLLAPSCAAIVIIVSKSKYECARARGVRAKWVDAAQQWVLWKIWYLPAKINRNLNIRKKTQN